MTRKCDILGYGRFSTADQDTASQQDRLTMATTLNVRR